MLGRAIWGGVIYSVSIGGGGDRFGVRTCGYGARRGAHSARQMQRRK